MLIAQRSLALSRFRLFDSSGSGRLSLRDLRKAVKEAQLPIKEHEPLGAVASGSDISGIEVFLIYTDVLMEVEPLIGLMFFCFHTLAIWALVLSFCKLAMRLMIFAYLENLTLFCSCIGMSLDECPICALDAQHFCLTLMHFEIYFVICL